MGIWTLKPVNPDEDHWRASTYVGPLIVRAPDEVKARSVATEAFGIAAEKPPGEEVPRPPWGDPSKVTCARLEDSGFDEEGPDGILGPE